MSINFDPGTGEIRDDGAAVLEEEIPPGEPPADPEEFPPPPEENDGEQESFDALLYARDAAEVVSEILGRRVSTGEFRRMVFAGTAPKPATNRDQWSHAQLEQALAQEQPTAPVAGAGSGVDFELFARDAAEVAGELLGIRLTAAGFRQLVIDGDAPAPIPGTDRWSQKAVAAWASARLEAEAAEDLDGEAEAEAEAKPVHRDVFDFYDRTFSGYYELHDGAPNAKNRAEPKMTWCTKWWLHRGVVGRLTACWFAWEAAYADGGSAVSAWILEHADRHFDRIMAADGPLRMCKTDHSDALDIYPTQPAPESVRTPEDEGAEQ